MPAPPSEDTLLQWFDELSNWGRWGDDDQLGTLNLITPEVRRRAAASVTDGVSVSCSWDVPTGSPGIERTITAFDGYDAASPEGATARIGYSLEHITGLSFHGYAL